MLTNLNVLTGKRVVVLCLKYNQNSLDMCDKITLRDFIKC